MKILYTVPTLGGSARSEGSVGRTHGNSHVAEGFAPVCELIKPSVLGRVDIRKSKGALKLIFTKPDGSAAKALGVKLGGLTLRAEDGVASLRPDLIPDGVIRPILLTEEGEIACEPFKKSAEAITALPTEDITLRNMLGRLRQTEQRILELQKEVDRLTELVGRELVFKL